MRFIINAIFGNRVRFLAGRTMIQGGAQHGNRDSANAWYEWDGRGIDR